MVVLNPNRLVPLGRPGCHPGGVVSQTSRTVIRLHTRTPPLASSSSWSSPSAGWSAGLVGKGLVRGFKRVERAVQTRSAGELTVAAIGLLVGLLVSALLWFPVHTLPYIGKWVILPLFLVVGYLFAVVGGEEAPRHPAAGRRPSARRAGAPSRPVAASPRSSTRARSSTAASPTSSAPASCADELVVPGVRAARAPAGGRLGRPAEARSRPPRPRGRAGAPLRGDGRDARRRLPRPRRRRREAAQARQGARPSHPHDRLQPEPPRPDPGRGRAERERAGKRAQAGGAAGRVVRRAR